MSQYSRVRRCGQKLRGPQVQRVVVIFSDKMCLGIIQRETKARKKQRNAHKVLHIWICLQ